MALIANENDLVLRYSPGLIGDLAGDQGDRILQSDFSSNSAIQAALKSATGSAKAALRQADRYTEEQISGLGDNTSEIYDEESYEYLKTIVCQIAFWYLYQRKPWNDSNEASRRQAEGDYKDALDKLRTGVHILNLDTAAKAGLPKATGVTDDTKTTMWSQIPVGRWYPRRNPSTYS